jgi:hypothetical protein
LRVQIGLPYHIPHKFRHGHAVYALKNAKDVPALKAVSQNLMHANLSNTDGVYGILSDGDIKKEIHALGSLSEKEMQLDTKELVNIFKRNSTGVKD